MLVSTIMRDPGMMDKVWLGGTCPALAGSLEACPLVLSGHDETKAQMSVPDAIPQPSWI